MSYSAGKPTTLLVHSGELTDIRMLLEELGVGFVERHPAAPTPERDALWALMISTPQFLVDNPLPSGSKCTRLAIADEDSRTLRAMMRRLGVDFVVKRPAHHAAVRLLILHALYRGPEKRRRKRVGVGAPVRFRAGFRRLSALLVDASEGGCRMMCDRSLAEGKRIRLQVPAELAAGSAFSLRGFVVRCSAAAGEEPGTFSISVRFDSPGKRAGERLKQLVATFDRGPAQLRRPLNPPENDEPPGSEETAGPERRASNRGRFTKRVIALDKQATRVLLGRDISVGGMRVDANPTLRAGDQLRLALHVQAQRAPMVVHAVVDRDDGDAGLVLGFRNLDEKQSKSLAETIDSLPTLEANSTNADSSEVIISEILERLNPVDE